MKMLMIFLAVACSVQVHAFTAVTLKSDLELKISEAGNLIFSVNETNATGNDYCHLIVRSLKNEHYAILKKGAVFAVNEESSSCDHDWGRQCLLNLGAYNQNLEAEVGLVCKDRGALAQKLTAAKINKLLNRFIEIK